MIYFIWSNLTEYTGPIIAVAEGHHGQGNDSDRVVKVIDESNASKISESSGSYIEFMKNLLLNKMKPHILLSESKQSNIDETTIDTTLARALTDSSEIFNF